VCKAWISYSHPTSQTAANLGFFQKPHRFLLFSLYSTPSVSETRREIHTMLDINLFRVEKGGNPEIIRESQRRRFANVDIVDEIIAIDKQWRQRISHSLSLSLCQFCNFGIFFFLLFSVLIFDFFFLVLFELENLRKDFNKINKQIAQLRIVSIFIYFYLLNFMFKM
jgi:hypothetical protein